jgi:hypothetical protein
MLAARIRLGSAPARHEIYELVLQYAGPYLALTLANATAIDRRLRDTYLVTWRLVRAGLIRERTHLTGFVHTMVQCEVNRGCACCYAGRLRRLGGAGTGKRGRS